MRGRGLASLAVAVAAAASAAPAQAGVPADTSCKTRGVTLAANGVARVYATGSAGERTIYAWPLRQGALQALRERDNAMTQEAPASERELLRGRRVVYEKLRLRGAGNPLRHVP